MNNQEPMLTICGQVLHTFKQPTGVDRKTGEEYGGGDKVQLLCNLPLKNGEVRGELVTLTTDNMEAYAALIGQRVRVPAGAYSLKPGQVGYFAIKGQNPEVLAA